MNGDLGEPVNGPVASEASESENPTPNEGSHEQETGPLSMAEAFAQAKAARDSQPQEQLDSQESESAPGESPAAERKPEDRQRTFTEQAALQRAIDLRRQGRENELSPEARGLLRKFEEDLEPVIAGKLKAREAEEAEFKKLFLHLDSLRLTDREAFDKEMDEIDPRSGTRAKLQFFYAYKDAHPEISAENPNPEPRQKSVQEIYGEVASTYGKGFEQLVDAIGRDGGIDAETMQQLKAEYRFGSHPDSGNLATFGAKLITALAEAAAKPIVEKEVAKVREAERKAYDLQVQTLKNKGVETPRQLSGGTPDPRRKNAPGPGPISMADAVRAAKEQLATV